MRSFEDLEQERAAFIQRQRECSRNMGWTAIEPPPYSVKEYAQYAFECGRNQHEYEREEAIRQIRDLIAKYDLGEHEIFEG